MPDDQRLQRWELFDEEGPETLCEDGNWCRHEDVAALESSLSSVRESNLELARKYHEQADAHEDAMKRVAELEAELELEKNTCGYCNCNKGPVPGVVFDHKGDSYECPMCVLRITHTRLSAGSRGEG